MESRREQLLKRFLPTHGSPHVTLGHARRYLPGIPLIFVAWTSETNWSALFASDDDVYYWRPESEICLKAPVETESLNSDLAAVKWRFEETIDGMMLSC